MKEIEDGYILSSGKKIRANYGLLSLESDGSLYEGYDSYIYYIEDEEERKEIAEEMIARWKKFGGIE